VRDNLCQELFGMGKQLRLGCQNPNSRVNRDAAVPFALPIHNRCGQDIGLSAGKPNSSSWC
jgi:hypothetical protein